MTIAACLHRDTPALLIVPVKAQIFQSAKHLTCSDIGKLPHCSCSLHFQALLLCNCEGADQGVDQLHGSFAHAAGKLGGSPVEAVALQVLLQLRLQACCLAGLVALHQASLDLSQQDR